MSTNDRVIIFDTTLRDGEQCPGASMNTAEKLHVATQLEKLGVDVIEAGFPAASPGDLDAVRQIAAKLERTAVAGLCRTGKQDIDLAWEGIKNAKKPRIHTFLATSDIHLQYKLKMTRDEVVKEVVEAVRYAKTLTPDVEFSCEDGSRSDRDFICRVFEAAIAAGATTLNLPDTVGYAVPQDYADLIGYVLAHTPGIEKAVLSVHCHNDLGLATANTLAAIRAGARQAEVCMNGIGERAGNTSLEEVVMALKTRPSFFNVHTGINTEFIYPTSRMVSMITGLVVQPNKAIVGANAFAHEAGIHQDGVLKNPLTYEIMKPEDVGINTNKLVLGKHSGRHALRSHLQNMGYDLSDDELDTVFKQFKDLADKKKTVVDEDLEALVNEGVLRTDDVYSLDYLHVTAGSTVLPMASVKMSINGQTYKDAGFGNGPIDAIFLTIDKITRNVPELLQFSVSSITGGTDAQGEVIVRMKMDELEATGKGSDADITTAAAKAYINGLNRLEYMKKNRRAMCHRDDSI